MSKLTVKVLVEQTVKLDRRKLKDYAAGVRERFEHESTVFYMEDLVAQAVLDGDLPDLEGLSYTVDDNWGELTSEDIAELSRG